MVLLLQDLMNRRRFLFSDVIEVDAAMIEMYFTRGFSTGGDEFYN